jgi:hypothetical protein
MLACKGQTPQRRRTSSAGSLLCPSALVLLRCCSLLPLSVLPLFCPPLPLRAAVAGRFAQRQRQRQRPHTDPAGQRREMAERRGAGSVGAASTAALGACSWRVWPSCLTVPLRLPGNRQQRPAEQTPRKWEAQQAYVAHLLSRQVAPFHRSLSPRLPKGLRTLCELGNVAAHIPPPPCRPRVQQRCPSPLPETLLDNRVPVTSRHDDPHRKEERMGAQHMQCVGNAGSSERTVAHGSVRATNPIQSSQKARAPSTLCRQSPACTGALSRRVIRLRLCSSHCAPRDSAIVLLSEHNGKHRNLQVFLRAPLPIRHRRTRRQKAAVAASN